MASKKRKKKTKKKIQAKPSPQQLKAIERLMDKGEADKAIVRLETLVGQYPKFSILYLQLIELYKETDDQARAAWTALRWTQNSPRSLNAWLSLYDHSIDGGYLALAHNSIWNFNQLAEQSNEAIIDSPSLDELEEMVLIVESGNPALKSMEDALLFDMGKLLLDARKWQLCLPYLDNLREELPPSANNYALALFQLGDIDESMSAYQDAYIKDSDNLFAMSAYIRLLVWEGQIDEANSIADALKNIRPSRPLYADGQLSALAFLGRHKEAYTCYQQLNEDVIDDMEPDFYHLAGCVAFRVDDRMLAKKMWRRSTAESNRGDEKNPIDLLNASKENKRNPAMFSSSELFPYQWLNALRSTVRRSRTDKDMLNIIKKELVPYPSLEYLRLAYESCDNMGCHLVEMVLSAKAATGAVEEKQLLLDFLKMQRTDVNSKMSLLKRLQTLDIVNNKEAVEYWTGEEMSVLQPMNFSITREAKPTSINDKDMESLGAALDKMRQGESAEAREILKGLVKRYPNDESLRGNIAASWEYEDKNKCIKEYTAVVKDFPDYIFARCMLATYRMDEGNLVEADQLLVKLMEQREFHIQDYILVNGVSACLQAHKGNDDAALSVLDSVDQILEHEDDKPYADYWKQKVAEILHPKGMNPFDKIDMQKLFRRVKNLK